MTASAGPLSAVHVTVVYALVSCACISFACDRCACDVPVIGLMVDNRMLRVLRTGRLRIRTTADDDHVMPRGLRAMASRVEVLPKKLLYALYAMIGRNRIEYKREKG